jgi:hypothetical protein
LPTLTAASIANQALRHLGDEKILGLDDTERRAVILNEYYETARDYVLEEHPWNFALKRARLVAFTTPSVILTPSASSGSNVQFTTDGAAFASTDVDRVIVANGGRATVTAYVSATEVTVAITTALTSTASVASGSWSFYYPTPPFGYDYSLALPSDWLRGWRLSEDTDQEEDWQREGSYILSRSTAMDFRYIARIEDVSKFSMHFVRCLVAYLTTTIAEGITGQGSKQQYWMQVYQAEMRRARTIDGQEGAPERVRSDSLIDVRMGRNFSRR